jgi:hypothetical protein
LSDEYGPRSYVSKETGVSFQAIRRGLEEIKEGVPTIEGLKTKIRLEGGGRKKISESSPVVVTALKNLVESTNRGDPESPLLWTSKSSRNLTSDLNDSCFKVFFKTVSTLLSDLGYSLQANKKVLEGAEHPDRNSQFEFISRRTRAFMRLINNKGYVNVGIAHDTSVFAVQTIRHLYIMIYVPHA